MADVTAEKTSEYLSRHFALAKLLPRDGPGLLLTRTKAEDVIAFPAIERIVEPFTHALDGTDGVVYNPFEAFTKLARRNPERGIRYYKRVFTIDDVVTMHFESKRHSCKYALGDSKWSYIAIQLAFPAAKLNPTDVLHELEPLSVCAKPETVLRFALLSAPDYDYGGTWHRSSVQTWHAILDIGRSSLGYFELRNVEYGSPSMQALFTDAKASFDATRDYRVFLHRIADLHFGLEHLCAPEDFDGHRSKAFPTTTKAGKGRRASNTKFIEQFMEEPVGVSTVPMAFVNEVSGQHSRAKPARGFFHWPKPIFVGQTGKGFEAEIEGTQYDLLVQFHISQAAKVKSRMTFSTLDELSSQHPLNVPTRFVLKRDYMPRHGHGQQGYYAELDIDQPRPGVFRLHKFRLDTQMIMNYFGDVTAHFPDNSDYRPYLHRLLEVFQNLTPSKWCDPAQYITMPEEALKPLSDSIALFFSPDEAAKLQQDVRAKFSYTKWASIPKLNLGLTKLPVPGNGDVSSYAATGQYLVEQLSALGIMSREEAARVVNQRLINAIMPKFQLGIDSARNIVGAL